MLAKSFLLVKTEFSDLDGLRWTQHALREFQVRHFLVIHGIDAYVVVCQVKAGYPTISCSL